MSTTTAKPFAALNLTEWADYMREIVQREGRAVRAGAALTIETKSLTTTEANGGTTNEWYSLPLPPVGKPHFPTVADRDTALARILAP
jgi:hypothetical protein